ncbi:hypothetical protein JCM10207_001885 [Rhodosporidiobolus poonsookiae]
MAVTTSAATSAGLPAAPIPLFHQSSQYRHWRYSQQGLDKIRQELNAKAIERVRSSWEEERASQATSATPTAGSTPSGSAPPSQPATPPPPSEIEYLTVADELSLVTYYLTQIQALCGAFQFPEMVAATAMTYLKRFYLRNTCMDYHPKNVMLTCVFLATKTENFPISIDAFASRVKTPPSDILALEFLVSQSLRFEYKVHHAHLALQGLILDMQTAGVDLPLLSAAAPKAHAFVRASRLTSAEFVYSPAQIALACFRLADAALAEQWLGVKEARLGEASAGAGGKGKAAPVEGDEEAGADKPVELPHEAVLRLLDGLQATVQEAKTNPVDKAKVTEVDKRLKWARNPEKDPKSAVYKKRKAEEDAAREEKERAKAAKRAPNLDENVFD